MKFVYCAPCGNARDHDDSDPKIWICLVCGHNRAPLINNNPTIRINVDPEVQKIAVNLPLTKHYDEIIIVEERKKRGRPRNKNTSTTNISE